MKKLFSLLLSLLCLTAVAQSEDEMLLGVVTYSPDWTSYNQNAGVYDINLSTSRTKSRIIEPELLSSKVAGVRIDNLYYATNYYISGTQLFVYHSIYDLTQNALVWSNRNGQINSAALDMTYSKADGKIYGIFLCEENLTRYVFGTLDPKTWQVNRICLLDDKWMALAAAPNGDLYALDEHARLLLVDATTGQAQQVATTALDLYFESSAVVSEDGSSLYVSVTPLSDEPHIAVVDLASGRIWRRITFANQEQVLGLCLAESQPVAAAPARPAAPIVPTCDTPTKTSVIFTMPTTLADGSTPGSTGCDAVLLLDGTEVYRRRTSYGATVTTTINCMLTGFHTITFYAENEAGASLPTAVRCWVGIDRPAQPQNVRLTHNDGKFHLTWDAVTEGEHGGFVNLPSLTYTINRFPGNVLVDGGLRTTEWEEALDAPEDLITYYYTVTAVCQGERSTPGESNHMTFSSIKPPYRQEFQNDADLEVFTIIDGNKDGMTWQWYNYNQSMRIIASDERDMDDWLITPPIHLEEGKYYEFSTDLHGYKRAYAEYFEIAVGTAPTAEAMTTKILPSTLLADDAFHTWTTGFLCPATGDYYFGLHAISPAGTQYIYADNFAISAGSEPDMPAAVTDLTVERAPLGRSAATISFTLPTQTLSGKPLTTITQCEVMRDGYASLGHFTNLTPGQKISFEDEIFTGFHRYTVQVASPAGRGPIAEVVEYIGPYEPQQPSDFVVSRTENEGEVRMTWKAPQYDVEGNELDPSLLSYTIAAIVNGEPTYLCRDYKETSFTYQAVLKGKPQQFVSYALYAECEGGSSYRLQSAPIPVGAPYEMPWRESFEGAESKSIWTPQDLIGLAEWDVSNDFDTPDVSSIDHDGGFIVCRPASTSCTSTLTSGLIRISGTSPMLEWSYYSYGDEDDNETELAVIDAEGRSKSLTVVTHKADAAGWCVAQASLAEYRGDTIQFQVCGSATNGNLLAYDNFRIVEDAKNNLTLSEVEIPAQVPAGKPFTLSAKVQNTGENAVSSADYSVRVLVDGQEAVSRSRLGNLKPGQFVRVSLSHSLNVLQEGTHRYEMEIVYEADDQRADNTSGEVEVACIVPDFPMPQALTGEETGTCQASLSWTAPTEPTSMPTETEDFEAYESWSTSGMGDWILEDADGMPTGTLGGHDFPGVGGTTFAYTLFDATDPSVKGSWKAHSGDKALMCIYAATGYRDMPINKWLISPRLSGRAQEISFWARSVSNSYHEKFRVYASSTGHEISDFKEVYDQPDAPYQWTEYKVALPEGSKYFAIRCYSLDAYLFMLDDITFTRDTYSTADLLGYNIYRDGLLLTPQPVPTPAFIDGNVQELEATYHVTAVYEKGESRAITCRVELRTGISLLRTEGSLTPPAVIYSPDGRRLRNPQRGVNIINGRKVVL